MDSVSNIQQTTYSNPIDKLFGWLSASSVNLVLFIICLSIGAAIVTAVVEPDYIVVAAMLPLATAVATVLLVRPELALILVVAYIPYEDMPTGLPNIISPNKLLGILLLLVFVFNVLFRRRSFRLFDDKHDFLIMAFIAIVAISGIYSTYPEEVISGIDRILRLIAFYLVAKNLILSKNTMQNLLWVIVFSGLGVALYGLYEYFVHFPIDPLRTRTGGLFMHPNFYATIITLPFFSALHLLQTTKKRTTKLLLIFCVIVILLSIVGTGSRGGFIAVGVSLALYIWRHPQRKRLFFASLISLIIAFPIFPDSLKLRLGFESDAENSTQVANTVDGNVNRRLAYVDFGLTILPKSPIIGYGYRSFSSLFPSSEFAQFDNPLTENDFNRVAHNMYLETAVGTGLLGLSLLLSILFVSWWNLHQVSVNSVGGSILWASASTYELALIAFMIGSIFLSIEHAKYLWFMIATSSAITYYIKIHPFSLSEDE